MNAEEIPLKDIIEGELQIKSQLTPEYDWPGMNAEEISLRKKHIKERELQIMKVYAS